MPRQQAITYINPEAYFNKLVKKSKLMLGPALFKRKKENFNPNQMTLRI